MDTIEKLIFGPIPSKGGQTKQDQTRAPSPTAAQKKRAQMAFARSAGSGDTAFAQVGGPRHHQHERSLDSSYVSGSEQGSSLLNDVAQDFQTAFIGGDSCQAESSVGTGDRTSVDTGIVPGKELPHPASEEMQVVSLNAESYKSTESPDKQERGESSYGTSLMQGETLPYKKEILEDKLANTSPGKGRRVAVLSALRKLGIKVFVIDGTTAQSTHNLMQKVRLVTNEVARENSIQPWAGPLGYLRCILYQDAQGRLFNLTFPSHCVGPIARWKEYLDSFSSTQAMIALMVLCRSFPCATGESTDTLHPAYLSLILGLVFTEEISLSGLNSVMLVRCAPSVSAHFMMSNFGPDFLRKAVIFILAVAAASSGQTQQVMTLVGIAGACMALLANMGARAWHFLRWEPMPYSGPGATIVAYCLAVMTGLFLPFMSHRTVAAGGKGALESIIQSGLMVAFCFVLSDYNEIQQFLVVGSENCNQDFVNVVGALWWTVTLISSLVIVRRIPYNDIFVGDGERLLEEDHASPVGYKVPKLPDFVVDPVMSKEGHPWFSVNVEFAFGLFLAVATGFAMAAFTLSDWEDAFVNEVDGVYSALKNDLT